MRRTGFPFRFFKCHVGLAIGFLLCPRKALTLVTDVKVLDGSICPNTVTEDCLIGPIPTGGGGAPVDRLGCLVKSVQSFASKELPPESSSCEILLRVSETWQISHYCIAVNSATTSGWGFKIPLATILAPKNVTSISFTAQLVPTTGPNDVAQGSGLPIKLVLRPDHETKSTNETALSSCQLGHEEAASPVATVMALTESPAIPADESPRYHARNASVLIRNPEIDDSRILIGDSMLVEIIADPVVLANHGVLPPALSNPIFSINHTIALNPSTTEKIIESGLLLRHESNPHPTVDWRSTQATGADITIP